jgi:hypothetical protein
LYDNHMSLPFSLRVRFLNAKQPKMSALTQDAGV